VKEDELLAELGGLRVLDAVWFPFAFSLSRAYVRIDGIVYLLIVNDEFKMLDLYALEELVPADDTIIAEMRKWSVGPHVVEVRGRCTCKPCEPGCVDAVYAVEDATGLCVLDVGTVAVDDPHDLDGGVFLRRLYKPAGIDAPWLHGTREVAFAE
jgi:hypothetical protein